MTLLANSSKRRAGMTLAMLLAELFPLIFLVQAQPAVALDAPPLIDTRCAAMSSQVINTTEISVQVTSAQSEATQGRTCTLRGYVAPNVGFRLLLPTDGWNGKAFMSGCGGACGSVEESYNDGCDAAVQQGYACIMTDTGHTSTSMDGLWARDDLQAQVDFGYRAIHVAAVAGKALTERYFGKPPARAYFWGCSTGGRQGLVEAQRFPWDFDGIIAGAPWIDDTASTMDMVWVLKALHTSEGKPAFSYADLELIHRAVLAKCDLQDGLKDSLLGNPLACDFDPRALSCGKAPAGACLSADKTERLYRAYDGPRNSKGERTFFRGPVVGSELNWEHALIETDAALNKKSAWWTWAEEYFRYMLMPAKGGSWSLKDFDFDRDYKTMGGTSGPLLFAGNPDLRRLKGAGGKLMIYQGWGDPMGSIADATIDYYQAVERVTGDAASTRNFARLFMIPGMSHCGGGEGPTVVDFLHYMEGWVERGELPDRLVGYHMTKESPEQARMHAPTSGNTAYSRPIFPYPYHAIYSGRGDPNDEKSFKARP